MSLYCKSEDGIVCMKEATHSVMMWALCWFERFSMNRVFRQRINTGCFPVLTSQFNWITVMYGKNLNVFANSGHNHCLCRRRFAAFTHFITMSVERAFSDTFTLRSCRFSKVLVLLLGFRYVLVIDFVLDFSKKKCCPSYFGVPHQQVVSQSKVVTFPCWHIGVW